jgi:hypothetical protein
MIVITCGDSLSPYNVGLFQIGLLFMQDDEEQPLAIAFCDRKKSGEMCEELVFAQDLFWGTIHRNLQPNLSTAYLTQRNNVRFERVLWNFLPHIPASIRGLICHYLHLHF